MKKVKIFKPSKTAMQSGKGNLQRWILEFISKDTGLSVLMDWESSIMEASADYVCSNGGDILEIGFGMGISAGYISETPDVTTISFRLIC